MLLGGQTTEFHMMAILPIVSYTNVGFPWIQFAYQLKATPFGRLAEQFSCTVHSHLASFNMVPMHFGALRGHPPSNGANWECQAKPRVRAKSGPVETGLTGLTGPVGMAPINSYCKQQNIGGGP